MQRIRARADNPDELIVIHHTVIVISLLEVGSILADRVALAGVSEQVASV